MTRSVLFIAPSAYVLGGLATWLDYMEPGLVEQGWQVTVGLVQGPRHHQPQHYLARHPHRSWHAVACRTGTPEGRARAVERAVAALRPDVVATVNLPDAIVGAARARARHLPALRIVMTIHGIQPDLYDDVRHYAPWIDRVLCVNRLASSLVRVRSGLPAERVGYAPCGVAVNGVCPSRAPAQRLRIAFVGRLEQDQKRVQDLPRILSALSALSVPFELLIAGTGPEEAALRQALAPQVAAGAVRFLGFLTPQQLDAQVLQQADVLLLTSVWETGPLVVWEAMANGVAVVSTRYVGAGLEAALAHESNALLFPPGDCTEAARQLQRMWADHELRQSVREAAFELIRSRYSMAASVAHWSRELHAACQMPPLPAAAPIPVARATGRLDRLLGPQLAETVRGWLNTQGPDGGPAGEWPHTHATAAHDDAAFWAQAARLDASPGEAAPA